MRYVKGMTVMISAMILMSGCNTNKNEVQIVHPKIIAESSLETVDTKKGIIFPKDINDIQEKNLQNSLSDSVPKPIAQNRQEANWIINKQQNMSENNPKGRPSAPKILLDMQDDTGQSKNNNFLKKNTGDIQGREPQNSSSESDSKLLVENSEEISKVIDKQQSAVEKNLKDNSPEVKTFTDAKNDTDKIENDEFLVIGEKMFLTQINEIYFDFQSYKDKLIVVEGMYTLFYNFEGVQNMPAVYRNSPGCCGNDGWGGFFLKYDGELPEDNDWIKVSGTPEIVNNGYYDELYLKVTNIEVLTERGAEFVEQ